MALTPGTRLGPYEVTAQIGVGGMGEVYRATDMNLGREVAIKVLPETFAHDAQRLVRFEREAKALASLNHPHIAAIYGFEKSAGANALVMELVEGPMLADRIAQGAMPIDEALPIAKQIAEALEAAHEQGIIHRDLKPANIKIRHDGTVKVLDFGLAKALADDPATANMGNSPTLSIAATMQGVILGTAAYMSPEQAKGKTVDRRADVWAFGVVLYEMLRGKQLYSGETVAETLASVIKEAPPLDRLASETPAAVRILLRRCLDKDVRRRLRDIGEARIIIEDVLSGVGPVSGEAVPAARALRLFGWIATGAAAVLLGALVALSVVHFREVPPERPSVRFEVSPPEKSAVQVFRISPDGRYLAILVPEGGRNRLWLRPLDSIQSQPLAGTDGATYPFWSPDSAFLAFFAQDKLKKIAIAGGPPQTLSDAPGPRGGAWNDDGVILFSGLAGGIYRVPAAGGVPSPVTETRTSRAGDLQRFPEFLPGGNRFLYLQSTREAETTGIYAGSLDGTPPLRILPDRSNAVYVPPATPGFAGHLLFRRENTLMAQSFDPAQLRTTGEMFPLAEPVGTAANTEFGAFSASEDGVLAWSGVQTNRELVWRDRAGKRLGTIGKPGVISQAALSPDEKMVALTVGSNPTSDVWLQDVARGVISRFTFGPRSSSTPVWSPDGSRIVFSLLIGGSSSGIYLKPASGAGKEELLKSSGINTFATDWSPDGKFIVYREFGGKTNEDLWLLPLEGDHKPVPYLQTSFSENAGQFSPDGRWMAYVSNESGQNQVYVQTIPTSGAKWQVSAAGGSTPRWRRDGKQLFYIAADRKLTAVPIKTSGEPSGAFEAGQAQPLFEIEPGGGGYEPTADGQRFLVIVPASGEAGATPITVITHWQAGLKK